MTHNTIDPITLLSYNHVYICTKISFANFELYLFICFSSRVFFNNLFRIAACRRSESTLSPDGIPHIRTVSASFCRMARFFYKPATLIRGTSGIIRYYGKYVKKVAPSIYLNYFQLYRVLHFCYIRVNYIYLNKELREIYIKIKLILILTLSYFTAMKICHCLFIAVVAIMDNG